MNTTQIKLGNCTATLPKNLIRTHLDIISETLRMRKENRKHEQLKKIAQQTKGWKN